MWKHLAFIMSAAQCIGWCSLTSILESYGTFRCSLFGNIALHLRLHFTYYPSRTAVRCRRFQTHSIGHTHCQLCVHIAHRIWYLRYVLAGAALRVSWNHMAHSVAAFWQQCVALAFTFHILSVSHSSALSAFSDTCCWSYALSALRPHCTSDLVFRVCVCVCVCVCMCMCVCVCVCMCVCVCVCDVAEAYHYLVQLFFVAAVHCRRLTFLEPDRCFCQNTYL